MSKSTPTARDWRRLFDAAIEFKKLAPWEWMTDEDIFGVENPKTGEIGYCCVMGALGEHLALGVYLGTRGLAGYFFIRENAGKFSNEELMHVQHCLMVSYEDRDYLSLRERELIKKLGYRFRGRRAWPKFQRFDPGFFPWHLNQKADVEFLAVAIEQSLEVCQRIWKEPDLVMSRAPDYYLVRRARKSGNKIVWEDTWAAPEPIEEPEPELDEKHRMRLNQIKQQNREHFGFIEYDYFYAPMPVQENPSVRPYYPVVHMFVDNDSGLIVSSQIEKSRPEHADIANIFLDWLEEEERLPQVLLVQKSSLYEVLEPIARPLGIQLILTQYLSMMLEARNHMFEYWRKNF